jgi:hypothetical protein
LAAWDVRRAKVLGLRRQNTGIESWHDLVDLVMRQEPYASARSAFWIADNGSSHRGQTAAQRLANWCANAILVCTPVHASWLNQIEIYCSVVQRKVLMPNDFPGLHILEDHLLRFQAYYETIAKPFEWEFARNDLARILDKIQRPAKQLMAA